MIPFVLTLWRFIRAIVSSLKDPEFQALFFLVILTLLSGTMFYRGVEGWSLLDAFYFSAVTLTTVGYGDLAPSTAMGKIFTVVYLFVGIGLILGLVDAISKRALDIQGEKRRRDQEPRREEREQDPKP